MVLDSVFNFIFGWAVAISPLVGIIFISFILSLISTISWKYLTDQILLKSMREKTKSMQDEIKKHKTDPKKMSELNKKMMEENMDAMKVQWKQSIKPMIVTLVPFALAFIWIRKTYEPFGDVLLNMGGIWSYVLLSVVFSMILRKIMKVY